MKPGKQLKLFGEVLKTFGAQGELLIKLRDDIPEQKIKKEPLVIIIDGLEVPFYVQQFEYRGPTKAIVVFENMEAETLASELVGKKIYFLARVRPEKKEFDLDDLVGFTVADKVYGELGKVAEVLYIPGNPCLTVVDEGKETIVPINEELIERIDSERRTIHFNLPEGLLELYD